MISILALKTGISMCVAHKKQVLSKSIIALPFFPVNI